MSNRAAIIFSERTAAPGWFRVLGAIAWACGLALLVLTIVDRDAIFGSTGGTFGVIVGVLVLAAVGWLFWRAAIVVAVTDSTVLISYRPIRTIAIPRADIASVGTEMLSPSAFGGVDYASCHHMIGRFCSTLALVSFSRAHYAFDALPRAL